MGQQHPWLKVSLIFLLALLTKLLLANPAITPSVKRAPAVLSRDSEEISKLVSESEPAPSQAPIRSSDLRASKVPAVRAEVAAPSQAAAFRAGRPPAVTETVERAVSARYLLSLGTGVAVAGEEMGWVLHWGVLGRVVPWLPLYVGADIGAHYWRHSPTTPATTMAGIQILASAVYEFDFGRAPIRPYMGLSIGPFLKNNVDSGFSVSAAAMLRPGMLFALNDLASLSLEPRLGFLEGEFLLHGQASAVFPL